MGILVEAMQSSRPGVVMRKCVHIFVTNLARYAFRGPQQDGRPQRIAPEPDVLEGNASGSVQGYKLTALTVFPRQDLCLVPS